MAKLNQDLPQFGSAKPASMGGSQDCAQCEALLTDALDGTLSPEEQARFDLHLASCVTCSQMLADAKRGVAWLEMLKSPRPEPPTALLERILAQTGVQTGGQFNSQFSSQISGQPGDQINPITGQPLSPVTVNAAGNLAIMPSPRPGTAVGKSSLTTATSDGVPVSRTATVLPFRSRVAAAFRGKSIGQTMLQPRLAMTAAMAFFSIGLTLNLTGVRLNQLRASDLKPANLRRSFYQANAHVVRYYDNLKVVYELESRVRDLQRSSDNEAPAAPDSAGKKPADDPDQSATPKINPKTGKPEQKQPRPRSGAGTSRRQAPADVPISLAALESVDGSSPLAGRPVHHASAFDRTVSTSIALQEGEPV